MVVPGGFSYGDYLRAGAIARFAPVMGAVREFAAAGGPVLGICNGFQVLCEAGLLPGALLPERRAALRLPPGRARGRQRRHRRDQRPAGPGERLSIPVKHMSGRWFAPPALLAELEARGQIVFRYARRPEPERLDRRRRRS